MYPSVRHPAFWLAVCLIFGVSAVGLWQLDAPGPRGAPPGQGEVPAPASNEEPAADVEEQIAAETEIVLRTNYPLCEQLTEHRRGPTEAELGLERSEFSRLHPGWHLVRFGREEVLLARSAEEQGETCGELETYRTVTLREDRIVVLYGRRTPGAVEMLATDLAAEQLPPGDVERLATGIVVEGDTAVWELIETLRH